MKIFKYWKPIFVAIIILYGSISSGENLNKVNFIHIKNLDKIIHFIMYFTFSVSILSSLYTNKKFTYKKQIILTLIISVFYGLLLEYLQYQFTETRSAEFLDALINTVGAISGLLIFPWIVKSNLIRFL